MGIGPVPASKAALKAAGMELKDMEICEVNTDVYREINTLDLFFVLTRVTTVIFFLLSYELPVCSLKRDLLFKERIFLPGSKYFPSIVDPYWHGKQQN